jgi:hypothetical protein
MYNLLSILAFMSGLATNLCKRSYESVVCVNNIAPLMIKVLLFILMYYFTHTILKVHLHEIFLKCSRDHLIHTLNYFDHQFMSRY